MLKAKVTEAVTETLAGATVPLRIFVVENHADTREFLIFMLEGFGHHVMVADTMAKALREVPASNADVLISDIGLPDGDGWELLSRLNLPRPIYAIAMSGYGTAPTTIEARRRGFATILSSRWGLSNSKPFWLKRLRSCAATQTRSVVLCDGLHP